jgi:hypothetical protein
MEYAKDGLGLGYADVATALKALGLDYRQFNPRMGPPIPAAFDE